MIFADDDNRRTKPIILPLVHVHRVMKKNDLYLTQRSRNGTLFLQSQEIMSQVKGLILERNIHVSLMTEIEHFLHNCCTADEGSQDKT